MPDSIDIHDSRGKAVQQAVQKLEQGKLVIYPTETCYGIGCDATDKDAINAVYDAKQRPREKKLTAIVSSLAMAQKYCTLSKDEKAVCNACMPGPLTLLAEKKANIPDVLNDKFAFRVPGNDFCRELAASFDKPVVATSANISGQPSSYSVEDIDGTLIDHVQLMVNGGTLPERPSSTVAAIDDGNVKIFRQGPVKKEDIEQILHG
jgi:L-threonylcarbamoyladenylate synthase